MMMLVSLHHVRYEICLHKLASACDPSCFSHYELKSNPMP